MIIIKYPSYAIYFPTLGKHSNAKTLNDQLIILPDTRNPISSFVWILILRNQFLRKRKRESESERDRKRERKKIREI